MKLEYLKLTNFRGFREFEITFDPQFTVLLGGNMAGKSAVLDGVAVALSALVIPHEDLRVIREHEVHRVAVAIDGVHQLQPQLPTAVEAQARAVKSEQPSVAWSVTHDDQGTKVNNVHLGIVPARMSGTHETEDLPLIAQYGTQRYWGREMPIGEIKEAKSRYDAYRGWYDVTSVRGVLAGWMRQQTNLQRGKGSSLQQLEGVETAVKLCVNDAKRPDISVKRFWFDAEHNELRVEHGDGNIRSFAMLSKGYRNIVAMVADIARRASMLNLHHGAEAHQHTAGVVLIDELDLHLHPAWQQRIVADLRRTFPMIQFIVTTHSPQIVASVKRDQVRLLDRNQLVSGSHYVEGRDSSEILEDVFGVTARPEAVKAEIDALYRLIEDEDFAAAHQQLAALEERLGPYDAAMVRARWILDTEELQANRQPAAGP